MNSTMGDNNNEEEGVVPTFPIVMYELLIYFLALICVYM
jgi:hypothetical protein